MRLDIQYRIFEDPRQRMFLRENSYWYKYFIEDMKEKYKLKPADKINKIMDNIQMVRTFLDVLK